MSPWGSWISSLWSAFIYYETYSILCFFKRNLSKTHSFLSWWKALFAKKLIFSFWMLWLKILLSACTTNGTCLSLYHKYVEQRCPSSYCSSPKGLWPLDSIMGMLSVPINLSHIKDAFPEQLPSRFMILSNVIMAPITQKREHYSRCFHLELIFQIARKSL